MAKIMRMEKTKKAPFRSGHPSGFVLHYLLSFASIAQKLCLCQHKTGIQNKYFAYAYAIYACNRSKGILHNNGRYDLLTIAHLILKNAVLPQVNKRYPTVLDRVLSPFFPASESPPDPQTAQTEQCTDSPWAMD